MQKISNCFKEFEVINSYQNAKLKRDKIKLPASIDYSDRINNDFAKMFLNFQTVKSFLHKNGYYDSQGRDYYFTQDILTSFQSYALLRLKDYE